MFCSFSSDQYAIGLTCVENCFFTEFLPILPEDSVRVYLFGLYLCANPLGEDNSLEKMSESLAMSPDEIKKTFKYLKTLGLVDIASTSPYLVRFNSLRRAISPNKLYNKDKYSDFLVDLHLLFGDRELSENEIIGFLDFLEETKMEQGALLLITKYCVDNKGSRISKSYILKVADNWFKEGVRTLSDAENRVLEAEASSEQIRAVLKALKSTRAADITDRQMYLKWTANLEFSFDAIIAAAKLVKRGGMEKLDSDLEGYFTQGIISAEDINSYAARRKTMLDCAIKATKTLGLYYDDHTFLIDNYISDWFNKGYTSDAVLLIARYCAINDIRGFSAFAETVKRFYSEGYVSEPAIKLQLDALTRMDENIKKVLSAAGLSKHVTAQDRDQYRTWTERWRLSDEQILAVAAEAQGKAFAMSWISSRLSDLNGKWTAPAAFPTKQERTGLGDFEKAEIKEKLKQDGEYFAISTEIKKLEFELSAYVAKGDDIPLPMKEKLAELRESADKRIRELGYDPKELN